MQLVKTFKEVLNVHVKKDIQEMVLIVNQHPQFQMIKMKVIQQLELVLELVLVS